MSVEQFKDCASSQLLQVFHAFQGKAAPDSFLPELYSGSFIDPDSVNAISK